MTPSGHPGITFLASSGDGGTPGGYPAFSPNVVAVGGTELTMNGDSYGSETAWSFAALRTLKDGSGSYLQFGSWTSASGGFSGTYSTAAGGSSSAAEWTTSISSSDQGWSGGTEVSATWVPSAGNATNATYEIYDGSAASGTLLDTVTVDQTKAPQGTLDGSTQFQELGDYYPESGTITVVLSANSANGSVVADAIGIAPAWATAGGQSQYESEPAYQFPVQSTGSRSTPDVSFDGSDNSGVTCYQNGRLEYDYYGTSLSSPCWAGIIAIANQGRVASGGTVFNSTADPMQTLEALYSLPSSDFHDITSGYNGLYPGPGYDELTGLGSPIANLLVPDLVSYDTGATTTGGHRRAQFECYAGSDFGLTVSVENTSGDLLSSYNGEVTITLANNPGTGRLAGTLTLAVTNGMASFSDLKLDTVGTGYTLRASSSGLASLVTSPFNVTPAAAVKLVVSTEPSPAATAGQAFSIQPVIEEEDQYGNIETSDNSTVVTASLESGVGPLQGTAIVRLSEGSGGVLAPGRRHGGNHHAGVPERHVAGGDFKRDHRERGGSEPVGDRDAALKRGDGRPDVPHPAGCHRRGPVRQHRDDRQQHGRDRVARERNRAAPGNDVGHRLGRNGELCRIWRTTRPRPSRSSSNRAVSSRPHPARSL